MDAVFLVYTVGKIGRGVLKRAKSTLDNVDAKVLGVILNNVKPEAGPEYFKYHSQHYYGPESDAVPHKKRAKKWFSNSRRPTSKGRRLKLTLLFTALILLAMGIYWQDLNYFVKDWLVTLQRLFASR